MTAVDDVLERVAEADPARSERPPAPGSARYRTILEAATADATEPAPRRGRIRWTAGVAAAVVAAGVGAVVVWGSGDEQTAEAAVRAAAEALDKVTSFEAEVAEEGGDFAATTARLRVDGADFEVELEFRADDGQIEHSVITVVDGIQYLAIEDGLPERSTLAPEDGLDSPYGRLAGALLTALDGADVEEAGDEVIAGVHTVRYDISLTERSVAALAALAPELPGFDDPRGVDRMSVWVADGHVHRIDVAFDDGRALDATFSNLNGDIEITAPPGPYVNARGN
jgi:hypothetical protein